MRVEERVGPYRILEEIGIGGMGEVSLAVDPQGRAVAVKVLHPAVARDEVARKRLEREVDTMRRVRGPHVAEVLDADFTARRPYIVTRYAPGRTLEAIVREDGPLRGAALARVVTGLARALAAVHTAGVVHRDLKPANVIIVDGEPIVIDFGLAHILDATRLTLTGTAIGTPGYLAPEILDGERAEPTSDVFSWGATTVFAATGRSPYGGGPAEAVFSRILRGRHDLSGLPVPLVPHVVSALAIKPEQRPSSPELLERLAADRAFQELGHGQAPEQRPRPQPPAAKPSSPGPPTLLLVALPALSQVAPTLTAATLLFGFLYRYAYDALKRLRTRFTTVEGTWFARFRGRLAALLAAPLEVALRGSILTAAYTAAFLAVCLPALTVIRDIRVYSVPIGLLAVLTVALRCRTRRRRIVLPTLAAVFLAVAAVAAPPQLWWPLLVSAP